MVTPSLVIIGEPNFLSITTLRPRGPRVTLTVSASLLTPRSRARRASVLNARDLAAMKTFRGTIQPVIKSAPSPAGGGELTRSVKRAGSAGPRSPPRAPTATGADSQRSLTSQG